jgi:HD-like signal output (HDOD) protein
VVSPLAEKTIKHVASKLETGEAAGLSEIVELIQHLSTNAFETSVGELATSIGKDVVVTAKVIAAANTIGYNPLGVPVSTITQAIHVIGFNKIRQLAVSLLLVENANRRLNPNEKREIAALALCSGLMAETIMTERGTCSPEHAFICASLRNYGRLLMTTFMIDDYRRAKELSQTTLSEDEAFQNIFGLTPLELGHHLLKSANLPDPILKSLRNLPPGAIKDAAENPDLQLLALADLSVKACELALRSDVSAQEFSFRASALASRSGKVFGLDASGLMGALANTGQQLSEFANSFGLSALTDQFAPRIRARAAGKDVVGYQPRTAGGSSPSIEPAAETVQPTQTPSAAATTNASPNSSATSSAQPAAPTPKHAAEPPEATPIGASPANAKPAHAETSAAPSNSSAALNQASSGTHSPVSSQSTPPTSNTATPIAGSSGSRPPGGEEAIFQHAFQAGIEQLAGLLDDDTVDMRKVYSVVLRSALVGFNSKDAIIFVRDARTHRYLAHFGSGKLFETVKSNAIVRDDERNVFGLCLQRMEDVLISDASDPRIAAHLPSWLKPGLLASFTLLPMQESKQPFAMLMTAWPDKKALGFTVGQIRQVRSLLKLVGTARKLGER